jgi:hypothetical protein
MAFRFDIEEFRTRLKPEVRHRATMRLELEETLECPSMLQTATTGTLIVLE